jgi:drug/metabolite transporter (DMT)-like permease
MSRMTVGMLSGLAAASIWGGMYVVSKVVLDIIPPFALITTRLLLGSLTLYLVLLRRGKPVMARRDFLPVFGVGMIGYGVSLGLQFIGTKMSTAANGALVTSATPAFVLLFAFWLLGEPIGRTRLIALIVSTIGVVAVIDPRNAVLDGSLFWGNVALLGAALTWALYSVLIRHVTRSLDVLIVTLVAFLGGLPISVPAGIAEIATIGVGTITPWVIAGVLFLGIVCTALAMFLWNNAFALLDAGQASLTFFAQPVVGALLGWLVLGEAITPLFLVGGVLIGLGLVLASRPDDHALARRHV